MQHPFEALAGEYTSLLAAMQVAPARQGELARRAQEVIELAEKHRDEWTEVEGKTGVPRVWGIASFERESSSDYSRSPAQGDRWDQVSKNVPRGLGPYRCWGDACIAAYRLDHLDQVGAAAWSWPRALYEDELFNGFGYRQFGVHSPYLWAWTNIYRVGKYGSDGRFDRNLRDQQCGTAPMMQMLIRLDPSLAPEGMKSIAVPEGAPAIEPPLPAPVGVGDAGVRSASTIQAMLNRAGADLRVDGSYGRHTRRAVAAFQEKHGLVVDGLAGPLTLAALKAAVAAH